jgi:lysophospholipase L1-like esterase
MKSTSWFAANVSRCVTIAAALSLTACDAVNEAVDEVRDIGNDAEVFYYLSVGTSLSVGVQPNGSGVTLPTDDGYPDFLFNGIRPAFEAVGNRELRLVKLGCPGETLDTFANGGSCLYLEGSQLDAAVDFLADNIGNVHLVTIDMGANDFRNAGCIDTAVDADCVDAVGLQIADDLAAALVALRNAAGPDTPIVGMNYYNPYLSSWLEGEAGQELAVAAAQAVALLNGVLDTTYETAGMPVADVALSFASDDFTTMVASTQPAPNDMLPLNVNNICEFTYMCDPEPRGPDIHANDAGYSLIADSFASVLP